MSDHLLRRVARLFAVAAVSLTVVMTPASARTVAIDQGEFLPVGFGDECAIGAACTPYLLPFDLLGNGTNTQLFVYRNGFVSLGAPVNSANPAADFSQYGVPTIAPLAYPEGSLGTLAFESGVSQFDDPTTLQYATPLKNSGSPIIVVSFRQTLPDTSNGDAFLLLTKAGNNIQFEFAHGGRSFNDLFRVPEKNGAFLGYELAGGALKLTGSQTDIINTPFVYTVPISATAGGVPEPAAWALMIGGFGLAGASVRRRRRAELLPA